jgi:uridine kinase
MKPYVIGIAGLSGSGKTALARELAAALEDECEILTLDSYYHPQSHLSVAERARLNYDHPDSLDWTLLAAHLESLARGEAIEEPSYLFDQHTRSHVTRRVEPKPYLILEGILALANAEIRSMLDLKIFVTTDAEECLRRRIERDTAERGRTRECVLLQYHTTVWPMAAEFVLPSREFADLVVSGQERLDCSRTEVLGSLQRSRAAAV